MDMTILVFRKYSRYAAIAIIGIVIIGAIFGGNDEEMLYYSVNGQMFTVPIAGSDGNTYQDTIQPVGTPWTYYGGTQQVSPNAYYDAQGNYEYNSRYGGGSQYADGSWNHYSSVAGGAVGGTADGCVYTSVAGGWSNC